MNTYNPEAKKTTITSVLAVSINGLLTNGSDPHPETWTSQEDKDFFKSMLDRAEAIIMGSTTFLAANPAKEPKRQSQFTVVLTKRPEEFIEYSLTGVREFWNKSASETAQVLRHKGVKNVILLGGGITNREFFAAGLVDEMWLTIEPHIFGIGRPMADSSVEFAEHFKLESLKQLNKQGSLLLHYIRL